MTPPLRMGVLGCGSFATHHMLPALRRHPAVHVVAVASRDADRAAHCADDHDCLATDYLGLLELAEVAAVYVSLPPALHVEWAGRALDAGKHVLIEKPLATNSADAAELFAAAARHRLVVRENTLFPFHRQHAAVRRMVDDGRLGTLRSARAQFGIPPRPLPDIRYVPELGGGALLDLAGYPLRLLRLLLGNGLELAGAALRMSARHGVDLGGQVVLVSPGGVLAHVEFGLDQCYGTRCVLWGDRARLELDRPFTPPPTWQPRLTLAEQDHTEEFLLPVDDQLANAIGAFVRLTQAGAAEDEQAAYQADVVATAELVDAIRDRASRVTVADHDG